MINMSYCRFENTAKAMRECLYAIHDDDLYDFSTHELIYFRKFFEMAQEILDKEEVKERILEWYSENAE
jgi:hypothetical protein